MRQIIRALAFAAALLPGFAAAQVPQFPQTLPANTVIGRLGTGAGPTQAIPFSVLMANIGASRTINTTAPLAGGGTLAVDRTLSITANGIDNTLIRQSGALTLIGRAANSTGNVADIPATPGSSCAFVESASTLICGQIATAGIANNAVDNTKIRQSGALTLVGRSANSTGNVADISATPASSCVFMENASTLACTTIATASITNNAVTFAKIQQVAASSLMGNPTGSLANSQAITLGAALAFSGTALQTAALTGDVTSSANSFATTIAANAVTNAKAAQMAAYTIKGNATGSTANGADISIPALTQKVSPAAGDFVMIADSAASNALKYALVSSIGSAGSVSSIAGNTGAFTLSTGLTNSVNDLRLALNSAVLQSGTSPQNPTATSSVTGVMMGLGVSVCKLTPTYSSRVKVEFQGSVANSTAGALQTIKLYSNSGAAPANAAAITGTQYGGPILAQAPSVNYNVPVTVSAILTGLTPGTAYWFDLSLGVNSGTATIQSVSCNAFEVM